MPNKCESCKHYRPDNNRCKAWPVLNLGGDFVSVDLTTARDICDREGDGTFVYFEPKTPTAGAAFTDGTWPECPDCTHSIHPNEEHRCQTPRAMSAAA